jgi:hypothetical protein
MVATLAVLTRAGAVIWMLAQIPAVAGRLIHEVTKVVPFVGYR